MITTATLLSVLGGIAGPHIVSLCATRLARVGWFHFSAARKQQREAAIQAAALQWIKDNSPQTESQTPTQTESPKKAWTPKKS